MPTLKVRVVEDPDQSRKNTKFIYCPCCNQKLSDLEEIVGHVRMRYCCRRCGTYLLASIEGVM